MGGKGGAVLTAACTDNVVRALLLKGCVGWLEGGLVEHHTHSSPVVVVRDESICDQWS